jgi:hypothetical protein
MRRLVCSKPRKAAGQRLFNPRERRIGQHVRLLRHRHAGDSQWDVPAVSDTPPLDEYDKKARALVASISAVGTVIAIGFLVSELLGIS